MAKRRTTSYTSFNMPSAITTPAATLSFQYGAAHQRTRQIAPGGTTIYLHADNAGGPLYEKETKSTGVLEHRYFIAAAGAPFLLMKNVNGVPRRSTSTATRWDR